MSDLHIDIPVRLAGVFTARAVKDGKVVRQVTSPNLITNVGLNYIGTEYMSTMSARFYVGVGSAPPNENDTELGSQVGPAGSNAISGSGSSNHSGVAGPEFWSQLNIGKAWAVGDLEGNLTEFGLGPDSGSLGLFSRSLILDPEGNPAAFTILSSEQLQVFYGLRLYQPSVDWHGTVNIAGVGNVDVTVRPSRLGSSAWAGNSGFTGLVRMFRGSNNSAVEAYTGGLVVNVGNVTPSGRISAASSLSQPAYVNNSHEMPGTITFGTGTGNGNIRTVLVTALSNACFQIEFDPPISKTNLQTFMISYNLTWGR